MSTQGFGPWPNRPGYANVWYLADGSDGWYVISPEGGECGPFDREADAAAKLQQLTFTESEGTP